MSKRKKKPDSSQFMSDSDKNFFSLSKYIGKKIADIIGYPSDPFGGVPVFKVFQIVFEDGTGIFIEGEHDVAYLPSDEKLKNMDEETLQSFIEE
jgi:hypothetical protein